MLRLTEYRFISRKSIITEFRQNAAFGAQNLRRIVEASRHKMKQPRAIKTITS